jgi:hypothetical protein
MEYILIDRKQSTSRITGAAFWQLTFYCLQTGELVEMSVDSSYRNFQRSGWDHIVLSDNPWGAYSGLRRSSRVTRTGSAVLSADSRPQQVWAAKDQLEAVLLVDQDQQSRQQPQQYHQLWETDHG